MKVDVDWDPSDVLAPDETLVEEVQLRDRVFVMTENRLIVTDAEGTGTPTVELKHPAVKNIKTTREAETKRIWWGCGAGTTGLISILTGYILLDFGVVSTFREMSSVAVSVFGEVGKYVEWVTVMLELLTWGGLVGGAALMGVMMWYLITYHRSKTDYLVIERHDRAPIRFAAQGGDIGHVRDTLEENYRQLQSKRAQRG